MRRLLVAALLLLATALPARAQLSTQCPLFARTQPGNSYTVSTTDECYWVVFPASGTITINIPTPSQTILPGLTVTLLPLVSTANFNLVVTPDPQSGNKGTVNNAITLPLGAGQSVDLRVGAGTNWYAKASGTGSGSGTITGPATITPNDVIAWGADATKAIDTQILYTNLITGTKSGNSTVVVTLGAAKTPNTIAQFDANGNITSAGGGVGTVSSVDFADPGGIFGHSGTPIIGAGTITETVAGTSGGVPYFSSASVLTSSPLLAANQLVTGGGIGSAPGTIGSVGTTVTVLHGNASGVPTFNSVNLGTDVTNFLAISNIAAINNNSVLGNVSGVQASPIALTGTQVASILDPTTATTKCNAFTSSLSGCAPSSGGGTANFLRADVTWAQPSHTFNLGTGFTITEGTVNASPLDITVPNTLRGQIVPTLVGAGGRTLSFPGDNNGLFYANDVASITFILPQAIAGNKGDAACFGDKSAHGFTISTTTSTLYGIAGVSGSSAAFGNNASVCAASDGTNWALTGTTSVSGSLSSTLNNTNIFVGNASNLAIGVPVTGDASVTNTGVWTNFKVNGVSYGPSPSTNTVPVVTSANTITYEALPNSALVNSTVTIHGTVCPLGTPCLTDTNVAYLDVNQSFTKGQAVTPVALTDGATITPDASVANDFTMTLGGNRTLANPTNPKAGQTINFYISQDGSGSRTLSFGSNYKCSGNTCNATISLTTTAGAKDLLSCRSDTTTTYNCSFLPNMK